MSFQIIKFITCCLLLLSFASCRLTERRYRKGFFVEWSSKNSGHTQNKKTKESVTLSDGSVNQKLKQSLKTQQDSAIGPMAKNAEAFTKALTRQSPHRKTKETFSPASVNLKVHVQAVKNTRAQLVHSARKFPDEPGFLLGFLIVLLCLIVPPVFAAGLVDHWDFVSTGSIILISICWLAGWLLLIFVFPQIKLVLLLVLGFCWNLTFLIIAIVQNSKAE